MFCTATGKTTGAENRRAMAASRGKRQSLSEEQTATGPEPHGGGSGPVVRRVARRLGSPKKLAMPNGAPTILF
jgi:hypothetical protein